MPFTHHKVRISSNQLAPGDSKSLFAVRATDYSDNAQTDLDSRQDQQSGPLPPGKMAATITGPVVIHGYSVRVFGEFFGTVMQGLSYRDDIFTEPDVDGYSCHLLGTQNASLDGQQLISRQHQRRDECIKNLVYLDGYRYQPARGALNTLMGLTGIGPSAEEYAVNFPKGLQLGKAHLQKKFTRSSMRKVSKSTWKQQKKSGFVLVPNTDTEFMSIVLTNRQHSSSDTNDNIDGWYYADVSIWMSYDNS